MIPRINGRARIVPNVLLFALALYAGVYGVTYAYLLHQLVNGLCAWLVLVHCCAGKGVDLERWRKKIWELSRGGHGKKRP